MTERHHVGFHVENLYAAEAVNRVERAIDSETPRNITVDRVTPQGAGRFLIYASSGHGLTHKCKVMVEVIDNPGTRSCEVIVHDDDYGPGRDGKCGRDGHVDQIASEIEGRFWALSR